VQTAILEEIGLTKGEVAAYLALLELGSATVGPIVDKAGVSYSKVYDILERLIDKGLVSYVLREKKKHFEAAPAERIMEYMEEKQRSMSVQKEELQALLPALKLRQGLARFAAEATIYKGLKGLETAFRSSQTLLDDNDEILIIAGTQGPTVNLFLGKFAKACRPDGLRAITNDKNIPWQKSKLTTQALSATIAVFRNRTIILPAGREIVLFLIESKEVAESFRTQFETMWHQRVTTYEGKEQLRKLWSEKLAYGEYCGFGEGTRIVDTLGKEFFIGWQKEKERNNIRGKVIIGEQYRKSPTVTLSNAAFKFISGYESPGVTEVFKDCVMVVNFSKEPVAFVIHDKDVARSHQLYFDLPWKKATD